MKKIILFIFILNSFFVFSQEKEAEVYTIVEEQAEYPGGIQEMYKFIQKNLVFPKSAMQDTGFNSCKSYIKFIVNEDGYINNVTIIKGCNRCYACDEEAMRIIKMMPKWKPGKLSGKAVKVYYNLPFNFKK